MLMKILMVMLIAVLVFWTVQARAGQLEYADLLEQEQIKDAIQDYFEMRYHYLSTLQLKDFDSLFAKLVQGTSFLGREKEKMEIELYHAELYHLRYVEYKFIRIDRLDAASVVKLPIVMQDVSGMAIQMQNPYPAPMAFPIEANDPLTPSPYPAP
jgi:hypothetical protein